MTELSFNPETNDFDIKELEASEALVNIGVRVTAKTRDKMKAINKRVGNADWLRDVISSATDRAYEKVGH